jgi:hypothetical protein
MNKSQLRLDRKAGSPRGYEWVNKRAAVVTEAVDFARVVHKWYTCECKCKE